MDYIEDQAPQIIGWILDVRFNILLLAVGIGTIALVAFILYVMFDSFKEASSSGGPFKNPKMTKLLLGWTAFGIFAFGFYAFLIGNWKTAILCVLVSVTMMQIWSWFE
ncbi:hypothetical protein EDD52_12344 [Primorskyibacter sedentarius]|uniref:Uncharacterized protein n=1 Tax=Primorskyibacter sedentarius TaxID=745311 RepID=A0A4R3J149_9RHOB|nr:hypothetical protein [Primorskyibacter sedentarius]TCS59014.1 hypothetical protein EDD52_12344 [Primorskyibacter sedentarius]